jgi:hypothetical protein
MTVAEIAADLYMPEKVIGAAATELVDVGLWSLRSDQCYIVGRFSELQGTTSTERTRRFKERFGNVPGTQRERFGNAAGTHEERSGNAAGTHEERSGNAAGTHEERSGNAAGTFRERPQERSGNGIDIDRDKDVDLETSSTSSLRSSVEAAEVWEPPHVPEDLPSELPSDTRGLKRVAIRFLDAFANVRDSAAVKKHGPLYVDALAMFRSRSIPTQQAWAAFCACRQAHSGRPLFGAQAKSALSYLPPRSQQSARRDDDPFSSDRIERFDPVKHL